ncbi:MAG: DinB family protein [Ignavibacteria bacterium]
MNEAFIAELKQEAASTRKVLERVPMDKADWTPHPKSMKLGNLANHVAELLSWTMVTMDQNELDFAKFEYKPEIPKTTEDLVMKFDGMVEKAVECLKRSDDAKFLENWTMRNGEQVYMTMPKAAVLRSFTFNHEYHHRAQLSVYLRLLDIPVPGIYGPTADEPM